MTDSTTAFRTKVHLDIQEQKLIEQKKDEFMDIASHEMKAPLSVIRGYLELLEMTLDVKTEEALFVNKALCSVTKLNNLINELLEADKMQFNVNLLKRINRELGADFDINAFEHYPVYNEHEGIAKSYLKSKKEQWVTISGQRFHFTKSELIHTEISRKYSDAILKNIIKDRYYMGRKDI